MSVMGGDRPGSGVRGDFSGQVTYKLSDKEDWGRPGVELEHPVGEGAWKGAAGGLGDAPPREKTLR